MTLPLPGTSPHDVVFAAPGSGPHFWSGAPSAVELADGSIAMAYRLRDGSGERDALVLARSTDGVHFDEVGRLDKRGHGGRMTERGSLHLLPDGSWRLYVCYLDAHGPHWWVGVVEAPTFEGLAEAPVRVVFPGDPASATVKDPQIRFDGTQWKAWLCIHPLDIEGADDRMLTGYATSDDGLVWSDLHIVLVGAPGTWNQRGARMTALLPGGLITFDGRASREENWFERTGIAEPVGDGTFRPVGDAVSTARYLDVVPLRNGDTRIYYEQVLPDESHELRTELIPA